MINLDNLGDFKEYEPKTRIVRAHKPFYEKNVAVLKVYSMLCEKTRPFTKDELSFTKCFVGRALESGRIDPKIGLGFLILSEDVLNVNLLGGDFPSIINPNIYTFGKNGISTQTFIRKEVKDVGSYCVWEGEIVGHESKAWREYMLSERTKEDKSLWLMNVYSGSIQDAPISLAEKRLSEFNIDTRTVNGLRNAKINTVEDLIAKTEIQIGALKNIGSKGTRSLINFLGDFGLKLKQA